MSKRIQWAVALAVLLLVVSPALSQARDHVVVRVGVGPVWGAPYPYYGYPYASARPIIVAQAAPPMQQPPPPQPAYWYYCANPSGYYPYIKECPAGWMTVAPAPTLGQPQTQPTQPSSGPGLGAAPPLGANQPGAPGQLAGMAVPAAFLPFVLSHGQELGLTPDQIQKLQVLRTSADQDAVARATRIRAAQTALNALLEKDQWDLPAIDAKAHELGALQADLYFADIKTVAAGEALLTPAQLQKLDAIGQWTPSPGGRAAPVPSPPATPGSPPAPRQ